MHFLTHQKIVPSAWQSLRMAIIHYKLYIKGKQASSICMKKPVLNFHLACQKKLTDSLVFTLKSKATIYRPCLLWC